MVFEFSLDDDELQDVEIKKLVLPPSAALLSRQIAKSQAKRAEKKRRMRVDLSTVRERDETASASPVQPSTARGSAPSTVLDEPMTPEKEPMDDEEAKLLFMLLSGCKGMNNWELKEPLTVTKDDVTNGNDETDNARTRPAFSSADWYTLNQRLKHEQQPQNVQQTPRTKVTDWLATASSSPSQSVAASVILDDLNCEEDDDDEFFDAIGVEEMAKKVDVKEVEAKLQGLSLNRFANQMTSSLVKVEEEITTDGVKVFTTKAESAENGKKLRSSSVSPRPLSGQQLSFERNVPALASFSTKHQATQRARLPMPRLQPRSAPQIQNGNTRSTATSTTTPVSRAGRSVLKVQNTNSHTTNNNVTPNNSLTARDRPSTPDSMNRPSSVASNVSAGNTPRSRIQNAHLLANATDFDSLRDIVLHQEEELRRKAAQEEVGEVDRKASWHSEHDMLHKQSASVHSSVSSLTSSKSMEVPKQTGTLRTPSRIPQRSMLPVPKVSVKRVSSVSAPTRTPTQLQHTATRPSATQAAASPATTTDECF